MVDSIFSKIYSYRERENKDCKENFLIEIFGHCLQTDRKFLKSFLAKLDVQEEGSATIRTQPIYEYGRPDLELYIESSRTCILIECKIEHFERQNQLEDYKKILLTKETPKRYLVYLTKYHDLRDNKDKRIKLYLLKWSDIYQIVDENNQELTLELKSYLKDENMDETKNFNYTDLATLSHTAGTIRKMNEVIDSVKEYYQRKIGIFPKESSRSTRLKDEWYAISHFIGGQNWRFEIAIGFMWFFGDEEVYLGARIYLPKGSKYTKTPTYFQLFKKYLKGWELESEDKYYTFGRYKQVAKFILEEEEQIPSMAKFLRDCIDQLDAPSKVDSGIYK